MHPKMTHCSNYAPGYEPTNLGWEIVAGNCCEPPEKCNEKCRLFTTAPLESVTGNVWAELLEAIEEEG